MSRGQMGTNLLNFPSFGLQFRPEPFAFSVEIGIGIQPFSTISSTERVFEQKFIGNVVTG